MDRHVTRWHQMISRDSFGSEILISCHPLEKRSNRLALLGQDWHIGVSGSWNTRLNGANLNGSCKGISSLVRKSIVLACPIGFEKKAVSPRREPLRWMSPRSATIMSGALRATVWTSLSCPGGFHILGRRCSTVSFYGRMLGVIGIRVLDMRGWEEISRD